MHPVRRPCAELAPDYERAAAALAAEGGAALARLDVERWGNPSPGYDVASFPTLKVPRYGRGGPVFRDHSGGEMQ
jgi:hypothetical protein